MAYELSGSIALGTIVTQNVTGASHGSNRRSGGRFSPDGTKLAVPVFVAPGNVSKIEIYQSGSSGWAMTEDFHSTAETAQDNPSMLEWLSDTEIVLGLRTTNPGLYTFVSSSTDGFFHLINNPSVRRTTIFSGRHHFIFNPSKTLVAVYKPHQGNTGEGFFDVHQCTGTGLWSSVRITPTTDVNGNQAELASLAWLSDTDIAVGMPSFDAVGNSQSLHGKIEIFRTTDGGSSFSSIDSVIGQNVDQIGASLYYHTASGNLIVSTGIPDGELFDVNGDQKWYLYQSSSSGYVQGTTDRTEITATGSWSGRVVLNYNMQADNSNSRFVIQGTPSAPNNANAEVLIWESGSEGWKGSVIDNNVFIKNVGPATTPLVGLSKLGFVAHNNNISPTDNSADKSFKVHAFGENCDTYTNTDYQLSGSITCGKVTATRVLTRANSHVAGGSISPDGKLIAAKSERRFGRGGIVDRGVDIWHSGSTGWVEIASVDTGTTIARQIMWLSNYEFLVVGTSHIFSFKRNNPAGTSWTQAYQRLTGINASQRIIPNADKTKLAIMRQPVPWTESIAGTGDKFIAFMTSGSSGYENPNSEKITVSGVNTISDLTWVDDSNIVIGLPQGATTFGGPQNRRGRISHYSSGSSGWTQQSTLEGDNLTDGLSRFGSMLYYHTASSTLLVGGSGMESSIQTNFKKGFINLIPSGSSSLLPATTADIVSTPGYELIDLGAQGLTARAHGLSVNNAPFHPEGATLTVDPSNGNRFVVGSAVVDSAAEDGIVFITAESGSSGWKFNQLNPEGDGLRKPYSDNGWAHQLSYGATRYVTTLTGSVDTDTTAGFTVYDTSLPIPGCTQTFTEYQISGSITCEKLRTTVVQGRANSSTSGGSISPDGTRIAVASRRVGGDTSANNGIDFFHSGSSGWSEVTAEAIDMSTAVPAAGDVVPTAIYWFSNSEILALTSNLLTSFVSSSSGWSENYSTTVNTASNPKTHMWVSPGKTVIGVAPSTNMFAETFMRNDIEVMLIHSSSTGFDDTKTLSKFVNGLEDGRVTAMAWIDEENVLVGQPERSFGKGMVSHYRSGSSGYTAIRTTEGNTTTSNGVNRFGSFIYWHSASNSGIYGADDGTMILNLIPSQSDGYLPASNPHLATNRSIIDTSMLQRENGNEPVHVLGTTINVDPTNSGRIVASSDREDNDSTQDGRVYFSLETGSVGWKVKQINADGDGVGDDNLNSFNVSQLTPGSSMYVTFMSGNANDASNRDRFTIYDFGLPIGGSGGGGGEGEGGGGGADPASFSLNPSATPLTLVEEDPAVTVGVVLGKQPTSDVVISIALDGSLTGRASLNVSTLTFTNANWNTQQDVTITASDNIDNDNVTGDITFSIVDASSDDDFDALPDQTVTLTITDNDTAGLNITPTSLNIDEGPVGTPNSATVSVQLTSQPAAGSVKVDVDISALSGRVSVDPSSLTFDDTDWNSGKTVTFTSVPDGIDTGDISQNASFDVVNGETDDSSFHGKTENVLVTVNDNDTAGFTLSANSITLANEADPVSMTVRLNAKPSANVIIDTIFGGISDRVERNPTQLTFTDANWNVEQTITFQGNQGVDGLVNGDASGTVTFLVEATSPATEYLSVADQQIPVEIFDDDVYDFVLTKSPSNFQITEGNSGTITVELKARPTSGNVVFDITTTGDAFTTGRASLSATSLTFPAAFWDTTQTITVNTQSDEIDNDNVSGVITFTVRQADTVDAGFHLAPEDVNLTVVDNDTRGLNFNPGTSLSTTEAGASATLTITLNSEPTSEVTVTCTAPDATEGTMDPNPVSLTFDASNYTVGQTITFTGIEDDEVDGNQSYNVTVSATSADAKYDGQSQVITITNVDSAKTEGDTSGKDKPSGENFDPGGTGIPPVPPGGNTRRAPKMVTQGDFLPKKLHFEPSTIETIDKSVLNYFKKLNLFSNTNEGWKEVPVIWGTAERAYQVKHNKDIRDAQGMLKLPIISIRRVSVSKDMASKGVFQGNISEINDEQGGSVQVSRVIYQEKTRKFASADALRLYNQSDYPRPNPKIVYRTVVAPMPVNVTIMYEITLRTEYQQQMNNLILPFVTNPGTINYIRLFEGEHRYEAFIQGEFQNGDNLSDFSSDERKFETKIQLKVIGYLIGQEDNREKPHYSVRENAVEVKIPRERISLNEVPPHEFGAYYGLSGVQDPLLLSGFPAPFFFSNVPAVGDAGGGGGGGGDTSGNLVTTTNFASVMSQNLVIREALKEPSDPLPADKRTFTLSTGNMANNTETVYLNGVLQEVGVGKDYTVTGNNVIVFAQDLDSNDSVFITYIKS